MSLEAVDLKREHGNEIGAIESYATRVSLRFLDCGPTPAGSWSTP